MPVRTGIQATESVLDCSLRRNDGIVLRIADSARWYSPIHACLTGDEAELAEKPI
jgi:hypothetical protein